MSKTITINEKQAGFIALLASISARVQVEVAQRKSQGLPISDDFVDRLTGLMTKAYLQASFALPPSATFSLMRQCGEILKEANVNNLPYEITEGVGQALEQLGMLEDAAEKYEAFESLGIPLTPEDREEWQEDGEGAEG